MKRDYRSIFVRYLYYACFP